MKFDIINIDPESPILEKFRHRWIELTIDENTKLVASTIMGISPAQELVINLFCGHDEAYSDDNINGVDLVICSTLPPQMELEALFRERNMVLAEFVSASLNPSDIGAA